MRILGTANFSKFASLAITWYLHFQRKEHQPDTISRTFPQRLKISSWPGWKDGEHRKEFGELELREPDFIVEFTAMSGRQLVEMSQEYLISCGNSDLHFDNTVKLTKYIYNELNN